MKVLLVDGKTIDALSVSYSFVMYSLYIAAVVHTYRDSLIALRRTRCSRHCNRCIACIGRRLHIAGTFGSFFRLSQSLPFCHLCSLRRSFTLYLPTTLAIVISTLVEREPLINKHLPHSLHHQVRTPLHRLSTSLLSTYHTAFGIKFELLLLCSICFVE
eukprot:SAG31_NODE_1194_length_9448_cov_9.896887_8_plen_159_part_00